VDHLFRHEAGRMVAALTRSLGPARLQLAEEAVQEALLQALKRWPFLGVPEKCGAWLYRVARNRALDRLRRDASFRGKEEALRRSLLDAAPPDPEAGARLPGEVTDDQLRLIFLCCHPELPRDGRVALTLKTVAGFSVGEIARAFLVRGTTVAQRLVRAQRRIRQREIPFEMPDPQQLPERLDAVLEVLYLLFNEGYSAAGGDALVRADLCAEALRLTEHLAGYLESQFLEARPEAPGEATTSGEIGSAAAHALAALLCFQASRLSARADERGDPVLLGEQDRSRWDQRLVRRAFAHLDRAAAGRRLTAYHLQAAIAAEHATADSLDATDWPAVLRLYDQLYALNPSPIVALNRAVALARVEGPAAALEALDPLAHDPAMAHYYLFHATRGELLRQLHHPTQAATAYRRALECSMTEPEARFLRRRLAEL
jgi:RNA polymerase sigma-70 factor (ECF subfamily)